MRRVQHRPAVKRAATAPKSKPKTKMNSRKQERLKRIAALQEKIKVAKEHAKQLTDEAVKLQETANTANQKVRTMVNRFAKVRTARNKERAAYQVLVDRIKATETLAAEKASKVMQSAPKAFDVSPMKTQIAFYAGRHRVKKDHTNGTSGTTTESTTNWEWWWFDSQSDVEPDNVQFRMVAEVETLINEATKLRNQLPAASNKLDEIESQYQEQKKNIETAKSEAAAANLVAEEASKKASAAVEEAGNYELELQMLLEEFEDDNEDEDYEDEEEEPVKKVRFTKKAKEALIESLFDYVTK